MAVDNCKKKVRDKGTVGSFFSSNTSNGSVAIIEEPVSPTARWSDSPIVQQPDSPTDVFVFHFHRSSKNSNKVKIRGNTSKDLKL